MQSHESLPKPDHDDQHKGSSRSGGEDPLGHLPWMQREPWKTLIIAAIPMALVFGLDQSTKTWALAVLEHDIIRLGGGAQLALTFNDGVAFGLGGPFAPVLVAVAFLAVFFVVQRYRAMLDRSATIALGLVLGGAVSNALDRIFRGRGGAVVDFIDVGFWPVFNVADVFIVTGSLLLMKWVVSVDRVTPGSREENRLK